MVECNGNFTVVQWLIGREKKCGRSSGGGRVFMKRKVLSVLLCTGLVVSMLAGCGSGSGSEGNSDSGAESGEEGGSDEGGSAESDLAYVQDKGTLVVGITNFEPMDYKDEDGNWIGFDADMAAAFAESLGVDVEFIEIDWDNKILELDSQTIDCVWNGMTLTDEVTSSMECTDAYLQNAQVVVVPADVADQYQDTDSLSDLSFAVEAGSAGEDEVSALGLNYTPVTAQADALMEVAAGTSDAAVIDLLMAAAMIGEGTSYADLTYTVSLNSEEYGVGFRKGSDLAAELNSFFAQSYEDGTIQACAEEYGVQAALIGDVAAKTSHLLVLDRADGGDKLPGRRIRLPDCGSADAEAIFGLYCIQLVCYRHALGRGVDPDSPEGLEPWIKL